MYSKNVYLSYWTRLDRKEKKFTRQIFIKNNAWQLDILFEDAIDTFEWYMFPIFRKDIFSPAFAFNLWVSLQMNRTSSCDKLLCVWNHYGTVNCRNGSFFISWKMPNIWIDIYTRLIVFYSYILYSFPIFMKLEYWIWQFMPLPWFRSDF